MRIERGHGWAGRLFRLAAACVGAIAANAAAAGPACEAGLSAAQRERFTLALAGCGEPAAPRTAPAALHADALVATAGLPRPPVAELPPRESAHLQLFGGPGVVMARIGEPPVRTMAAPAVKPARSTARPSASRAVALAPEIDRVARRHDIDPLLLHAIAHVESRHDPAAVSRAGARGVMQVMPTTGERFGVQRAELHHAGTNLDVSATYLKTLQRRFGTDLPLVLAAYNAGEGAVERHGRRIPQYPETQQYVRAVLAQYRSLQAAAAAQRAAPPSPF